MIANKFQAAQIHHQKGELLKALNIYQNISGKERDQKTVIYHALCLIQLARNDEAQKIIDYVDYDALSLLGEYISAAQVFKALHNPLKALTLLNLAKNKFGNTVAIQMNLAVVNLALNNLVEAEKELDNVIYSGHKSAEAWLNKCQIALRKEDTEAAKIYLHNAENINPSHADIYYLKGCIYEKEFDLHEAAINYINGLERNISSIHCWERLAGIVNEGLPTRDQPLEDKFINLFKNAENTTLKSSKIISYIITIQKKTLLWWNLERFEKTLIEMIEDKNQININPFVTLTLNLDQINITNIYKANYGAFSKDKKYLAIKGREPRIGIISSDLRNHAIGHLLRDLAIESDWAKKITCFYTGRLDRSDLRILFKNSFINYHELTTMNLIDKKKMIQKSGIDILIDLNAFTGDPSIELLQSLNVPIVHWLGLPSSTGSSVFDYLLCDENILPLKEKSGISEKPIYMPMCYVPSRKISYQQDEKNSKSDVVFGCFQNTFKYNPSLLTTWSKIMTRAKNCKFIIGAPISEHKSINDLFIKFDFDMDRIEIQPLLSYDAHMKRMQNIDFLLDTFPYAGGTSCADALSVCIPSVTLKGKSIVSKVASSIMKSANLDELIAENEDQYVDIAVELAKNTRSANHFRELIGDSYYSNPAAYSSDFFKTLKSVEW